MTKQYRIDFFDAEPVRFIQATCACCGDDIFFGETHYANVDGTFRCRQCKPTLLEQLDQVLAVLSDEDHPLWRSDEAIADLVCDADALISTIVGSDLSTAPPTADIIAELSEFGTVGEKRDHLDNIVQGFHLVRMELTEVQGRA